MIISIASGKGGTGKTTIATGLALSIAEDFPSGLQFLDCDVEEPNAHIFLKPQIKCTESVSTPIPQVDEERCTYCGKCAEICAYNAIAVVKTKVLVFPELCHGCGGCSLLCPERAIFEVGKEIGVLEEGCGSGMQFFHGRLNIGEAMPTPLIRAVKSKIAPDRVAIIDVPPGTSCPVIEAVKGSDFCILVTEPTPFGLNDLILAVEVLRKMGIPFGVIVNRADIGDEKVDEYCQRENVPILMRIPMDREIAEAYSKGIPMVEVKPEYKKEFKGLFAKIQL